MGCAESKAKNCEVKVGNPINPQGFDGDRKRILDKSNELIVLLRQHPHLDGYIQHVAALSKHCSDYKGPQAQAAAAVEQDRDSRIKAKLQAKAGPGSGGGGAGGGGTAKKKPSAAQLKGLWNVIDKDGSNVCSRKEVMKAVKDHPRAFDELFGGAVSGKSGMLFRYLDTDNSGEISWSEFEVRICPAFDGMMEAQAAKVEESNENSAAAAELKSGARNGAAAMDFNPSAKAVNGAVIEEAGGGGGGGGAGGGKAVTLQDILRGTQRVTPSEQNLSDLFKIVNTDGSGQMTVQQLMKALKNNVKLFDLLFGGGQGKAVSVFRIIDQDSDGFVSWPEFRDRVEVGFEEAMAMKKKVESDDEGDSAAD